MTASERVKFLTELAKRRDLGKANGEQIMSLLASTRTMYHETLVSLAQDKLLEQGERDAESADFMGIVKAYQKDIITLVLGDTAAQFEAQIVEMVAA